MITLYIKFVFFYLTINFNKKCHFFQLSADAERLMTPEYRSNKISQVRECIPDVDSDECLSVLQSIGWDVAAAVKSIKIEKLFK